MRRSVVVLAAAAPAPAMAHDAFGDLGPFYASFLHPLADPLQAALILGAAAYLAGRPLGTVRIALPLFVAVAALSLLLATRRPDLVPGTLALASVLVATGGAALLPARMTPAWVSFALVALAGVFAGLAPGGIAAPDGLQPLAGGTLGIAVLATLAWVALDALSRRISPVAPAVAGSWVVALGLLAGAFALAPTGEGTRSTTAAPPGVASIGADDP